MNTYMKGFFFFMLAVLCSTPDLRAADYDYNATVMPAYDKQPVSSNSAKLISGWFTIIWGDGTPESETNIDPIYYITEESGKTTRLILDEILAASVGGVLALDRRRVTVQGMTATVSPKVVRNAQSTLDADTLQVDSLAFESAQQVTKANNAEALVAESRPYISIMCKFADISTEPKDLAYFQEMYSSTYPGLDHYWREASYNTVTIFGSTAVGWYTLPHPRSYYVVDNCFDRSLAAQDCTELAEAQVDFTRFSGINLMFNSDLDGYAWGGSRYLTLNGVSKVWPMTWEPPWGFSSIVVILHEMGHSFGLPHSSGSYGQTYDNQWDVMSDMWCNCNRSSDATYGCLGQDTISYHKDMLGWIPTEQKFIPERGSRTTITLEYLDIPQTNNYKMVQIPIDGSSTHFYTVEARRQAGYDYKLPGQGVIIHEVDTTRNSPAYVIDPDLNGNTGDAGAMWTEGEVFSDEAKGTSVSVISVTATGYQVEINYYPPNFSCLEFLYRESGGNITITGYTGSGGSVAIPSIMDRKTVTGIGEGAFINKKNITDITVPDSITNIGANAFSHCNGLTSMTMGSSVQSIGDAAFYGCTSLIRVTIPASVTNIGDSAFNYCHVLTSIDVAANNPSYSSQNGVLYNKYKRKIIRYPGGKSGVFAIPRSVTAIGDSAFEDCSGLTAVIIGNRVAVIGDFAFYGCTSLTSAYFKDNAPVMKSSAFDNCTDGFTVYYQPRTTGFTNPWYGYRTRMLIAIKNCPFENILGVDNPYLENLRSFRDNTLALSQVGRKIIQIYYNNSDSINEALENNPALRAVTRSVLEIIAPIVRKN